MTPEAYPYLQGTLDDMTDVAKFLTPYTEAIEEVRRRSEDTALRARVEEYLNNDLPTCLGKDPVLYLARHVATPNFETLRFLHLLEPLELPIVISQDTKDKFVPANMLKRALGKLPICTRVISREGSIEEIFQNVSIIDFNTSSGRSFSEIKTLWGESLTDFHASLFNALMAHTPLIVDDSEWIDRNHRGNLLEHYKRFLALFVAHGVLFEDYLVEDEEEERFKQEILGPAFAFVEEQFGLRPLIVQLLPTSMESPRFWLSYPHQVFEVVKSKLS